MEIRLANIDDYEQIAEMRWQHAIDEDNDYGERHTCDIDKDEYIGKVRRFLTTNQEYKIFVGVENDKVISCMFVYLIPKVPNPNGEDAYIAYLTKVYTLKEYRGRRVRTQLLDYIKSYLDEMRCELIFVWPSDNSITWYEKNGFSRENEIMECILMDK